MESEQGSIEGQWIPLAQATDGRVPITNDDLDQMVTNFNPSSEADHIPVRFGDAKGKGPIVGALSALRRDKQGWLSGKFTKVDPRFDELYGAAKLGGKGTRSFGFVRDPEKGPVMTGYGFIPPRVYGGHVQPETEETLNKLVQQHRNAESVVFAANPGGLIVFAEMPPQRDAMTRWLQHYYKASPEFRRALKNFRGDPNSEELNNLAIKRQQERGVSFSEALSAVAKEHPDLTVPKGAPAPAEAFRFQTNSERLTELARQRQRDWDISYGEALEGVAREHPRLTLPGTSFDFEAAPAQRRTDEVLSTLAKQLSNEKRISFGEALSRVVDRHPELGLPGVVELKAYGL